MLEVRIGVADSPKELVLEMDGDAEAVIQTVTAALAGDDPLLWITDQKGKRVGVPVSRVAYVEIAPEGSERGVGFGVG